MRLPTLAKRSLRAFQKRKNDMASVSKNKSGRVMIQFTFNGARKTISLGSMTLKRARKIAARVEAIVEAKLTATSLDPEAAEWLGEVGDEIHKKLVGVGITEPRQRSQLGPFLDGYIAGRTDVVGYTTRNLRDSAARLVEFFTATRDIATVTTADAKAFDVWLSARYADATRSRTVKRAKQFFTHAVESKLLRDNPFRKVKAGSQKNKARAFFITQEMLAKLLTACPSDLWRLRILLSRIGGMRCPSEHAKMKWDDINWELGRFTIHGKAKMDRIAPLFPELREQLDKAWDRSKEGDVFVLPRLSLTSLREGFEKIIRNAGLTAWPRLFHNLRASRQTELQAIFPGHVVCAWMGNSEQVAFDHYLMPTDADYARALQNALHSAAKSAAISVNQEVSSGIKSRAQVDENKADESGCSSD